MRELRFDDDDICRRRTFVGDVLGLLSAVSYGLFTGLLLNAYIHSEYVLMCGGGGAVLLNKFCGHEERRVQKLFGYIGLSTIVSLWWLSKN